MASQQRQHKYTSPPPQPASMTPPPSSTHQLPSYPARTPTPTNSHLSSPPPTIKTAAARHRTANVVDAESQSSDNESLHSVDQLRVMLAQAQEDCHAAKTSAAHFRFQLELLNFESSEYQKRMEVELAMNAKEVDVLQRVKDTPPSLNAETIAWENRCIVLERENERLRTDLDHAKGLLLDRDVRSVEENDKLKKRIRDNRMRMNQLRSGGALFGETPLRLDDAYTSPSKARNDDPFGNLLLADQVLRHQEAVSTPSTPVGGRQRAATQLQSQHPMTSLPSTPYRSAPRSYPAYYSKPLNRSPVRHEIVSSQREKSRPRSRDSTISASEAEDNHDAERVPDSEGSTEDEVEDDVEYGAGPSRASQEAASMLRKSASFRQPQMQQSRSPASKVNRPTSGGQMYGYQITKPGVPGQTESIKRRFYDEGPGEAETSGNKKRRGRTSRYAVEGENSGLGLGLGIAPWTSTK